MTDQMACPRCDRADLAPGVLVGRSSGVKFKGSRGLVGDLTGIPLTRGVLNHSAPAWRCEGCGTVVETPER